MINKDLTFPNGDQPEYSSEVGSNNNTDDNSEMSFQDYSVDDIYYYLYAPSRTLRGATDMLEGIDELIEAGDFDGSAGPLKGERTDNNINPPRLYSVKDSEIRANALRTISNLKKDGRPFDAEAVIRSTMENMGIPKEIVHDAFDKFNITKYIEDSMISEENSSLVDNKLTVPMGILHGIRKSYDSEECRSNPKLKGKLFAKNVLSNPKLTYRNAKRKLNLLKKYQDSKDKQYTDPLSYRLYGGDDMLKFLEGTLGMWRENDKIAKKSLSKSGFGNAFIKPHNKSPFGKANESKDYIEDEDNGEFFGYSDTNPLQDISSDMGEQELASMIGSGKGMPERMVREITKGGGLPMHTKLLNSGYAVYERKSEGKYKVFIPKRCWRQELAPGKYLVSTRSCKIDYRR